MVAKHTIIGIDGAKFISRGNLIKPGGHVYRNTRKIESSCTIASEQDGILTVVAGLRPVELGWIGTFLVVAALERARANIFSASAYTRAEIDSSEFAHAPILRTCVRVRAPGI